MKKAIAPSGSPASLPVFDGSSLETVIAAFEPSRLRILTMLGCRDSMSVSDIAAEFKTTRPAISHHLKVLKNCKLVTATREGQEIYYSVQMQHIIGTLRSLADALEACCLKESVS